MIEFAKKFKKRCRPMLGTFVTVGIETSGIDATGVEESAESFYQCTELAFAEGARLEQQFSKFIKSSTLSRLNQVSEGTTLTVEAEFFELLQRSLAIWQRSEGAFNPFGQQTIAFDTEPFSLHQSRLSVTKNKSVQLDLNGIAKGFIVDRMVETLEASFEDSHIGAFVNAGGDVRYLNVHEKLVHLRSGGYDQPYLAEVPMLHNSFATSSWSVATQTENSSTEYAYEAANSGWTFSQTVGVNASECWVADAMTKVAMYASPSVAQSCAYAYDAKIFVFDENGQIIL